MGLRGYILNLGDAGVRIVVEGREDRIHALLRTISQKPPSISKIDSVDVRWASPTGKFSEFVIRMSDAKRSRSAVPRIPPDISICDACIDDIRVPESRWHKYPFTSCAACGPRYSTITALPYDRPNTTMVDFPLCSECATEYNDPSNRRHHAQTTACPSCGPRYRLLNKYGKAMSTSNPIRTAAELIDRGAILAVQGIGGTHLVTKTSDATPIHELRIRKNRPTQPFAIMVRDIATLQQMATVHQEEVSLLEAWQKPIVLVSKRDVSGVIPIIPTESLQAISPYLDTIGVMLPYSGIHICLFDETDEPALVMTSANPSGLPMYVTPKEILMGLKGIADGFLVHNRRIAQRVDDSVVKFVEGRPQFIRRARGYVPDPIDVRGIDSKSVVLATGPERKATATVLTNRRAYLTQHIGNTDNIESAQFLEGALYHLARLVGIQDVDVVACDLHPEFLSTDIARNLAHQHGSELVGIQHHHAHLVSLLADSDLPVDTRIACITIDGYGYAPDGTGWGGEVLVGNASEYRNVGGLAGALLPGGDLSARYSARAAAGILGLDALQEHSGLFANAKLGPHTRANDETLSLLAESIRRRINTIESSSIGRLLDAVAFVMGVCSENSYEGECPMRLESIAVDNEVSIPTQYEKTLDGRTVLNTREFLLDVIRFLHEGVNKSHLAFGAQYALGKALTTIAMEAALDEGIAYLGLSGGAAINRIIARAVFETAQDGDVQVLLHRRIPPGDGGISLGQAVAAAARRQHTGRV